MLKWLRDWLWCPHPTWIVPDLAYLGMGDTVFVGRCSKCGARRARTSDEWMSSFDGKVLPER